MRLSSTSEVFAHFSAAFSPLLKAFLLSLLAGDGEALLLEEVLDAAEERRVVKCVEVEDAAAFFSLRALLAASTTVSQVGGPPLRLTGDLPRLRPTGEGVFTERREAERPVG